jgi:hypothetical protein
MIQYVNRYPDGAAGIALLLLRICHAFVAFGMANLLSTTPASSHFLQYAAALAALLLVIGLATRWVALLLGLGVLAAITMSGVIQQLLLAGVVGGCMAIVLIGAGAFSLDARRHGRRVIQFQTPPPDRGGGN